MKLVILSALLITCIVGARQSFPFLGWDRLEEWSTDIIIANCGKPTSSKPGVFVSGATASDSAIELIVVLKGTNNMSPSRLLTDHKLWQGENYLIFGHYDGGIYQAFEEYRVIPLGVDFSTNSITGKPLDEQLQILFKQRIENLNREIENDKAEKQRLVEGLKK